MTFNWTLYIYIYIYILIKSQCQILLVSYIYIYTLYVEENRFELQFWVHHYKIENKTQQRSNASSHEDLTDQNVSHFTFKWLDSPQLGFSPDILITVEYSLLRVQQSRETQPTCSAPRWARRTTGSPASPSSGTSACRWERRERRSPASWWSEAAWPDEAFWCRRWPAAVDTETGESVVTQETTHIYTHKQNRLLISHKHRINRENPLQNHTHITAADIISLVFRLTYCTQNLRMV